MGIITQFNRLNDRIHLGPALIVNPCLIFGTTFYFFFSKFLWNLLISDLLGGRTMDHIIAQFPIRSHSCLLQIHSINKLLFLLFDCCLLLLWSSISLPFRFVIFVSFFHLCIVKILLLFGRIIQGFIVGRFVDPNKKFNYAEKSI